MCAVILDECASKPCLYGGTCVDGDNGFTCECPAGLTGTECSVRDDVCASKPCGITGTCFAGLLNNPVCVCNQGYEAGTVFQYICCCNLTMLCISLMYDTTTNNIEVQKSRC